MSATQADVSGMNFQKSTLHIFVCDSGNYMAKCVGSIFLGNLIAVTQKIVFVELFS